MPCSICAMNNFLPDVSCVWAFFWKGATLFHKHEHNCSSSWAVSKASDIRLAGDTGPVQSDVFDYAN